MGACWTNISGDAQHLQNIYLPHDPSYIAKHIIIIGQAFAIKIGVNAWAFNIL